MNDFLIIGIIVLIILLLIVIGTIILNMKRKVNILKVLHQYGDVVYEDKKTFIKINNELIEVCFFKLSKRARLSINSPLIWEVNQSGQSKLIKQGHLTKDNQNRIVIVYPGMNKILRYINENEVEFVTYQTKVYNLHIVLEKDLSAFLKMLNEA